ncbi:MAG: bifunctional (p)ppGpp synthetase/guanosine-3',5'-bis(diphosphate) 3'-pyrophosphohydrolase [Vampirovibrio sp.]
MSPEEHASNDSNQPAPLLIEDELMAELLNKLKTHDASEAERALIQKTFDYARHYHQGQKRKNGENYIMHPVSVALILADMWVDIPTLQAALMHDVLEDTVATPEIMEKAFGAEVTKIVQGVTKLGKFQYQFSSKEEEQAENFRNMFLAMAEDIRVLTLKLADRLHNMRTLEYMLPHKQEKIALETLEVFAPLANRIGMGNFKAELEDLSLSFLDPQSFQAIKGQLADSQIERERVIVEMTEHLEKALQQQGIQSKIYSRLKNYYSIYKKMTSQQKELADIFDISALRVIVQTEAQCYEVLGIVHHQYTPVAGRFKDYIAMPKSNFYQSLHTTIIGPNKRPVEVQIRTEKMHKVAEFGIAAHFHYKRFGDEASAYQGSHEDEKLSWLKQLVEMQAHSNNALEFVENVKLDLFPDQVFVFTPKGTVISLPRGSTPVDFAFRIHSEVGNRCAGSVVNEKMVPLDTELQNGDIIEIITNKKATPRLDWVNFVVTQQAKNRIRHWYKKHYRDQHEQQGKQLLEADLGRAKVDTLMKSGRMLEVAQELNYKNTEDLYVALGYGDLTLTRIINRVKKGKVVTTTSEHHLQIQSQQAEQLKQQGYVDLPNSQSPEALQAKNSTTERFAVELSKLPKGPLHAETAGTLGSLQALKGLQYHIARCCMPVPGDGIVGIVTRSRGVMIHRDDCMNIIQANPQRVMNLTWTGAIEMQQTLHNVLLEMQVMDQVGVFKDVLAQVSNMQVNIFSANCRRLAGEKSVYIELGLEVNNLEELEKLIRNIKQLPDVIAVKRSRYRVNK